jgi:hypothetical protein
MSSSRGRKIGKDEVILWRWRVEVLRKAEALFAFGNVPKGADGMEKRNGWELMTGLLLDGY